MKKTVQNSTFIDPVSCESSIGYYINLTEYRRKDKPITHSLYATVVLADCYHKIDWQFSEDGGGNDVAKIDRAIAMMVEFRKAYVDMKAKVEKLGREP